VQFDGHQFTAHNSTSGEGLDCDQFLCIIKDQSGIFWLASEYNGLYKYDQGVFSRYTPADMGFNLGAYELLTLTRLAIQNGGPDNENGALWIGTYQHGLIKFDGTNWEHYNYQSGNLPDNGIHALAVEESPSTDDYVLWVGTGNGLIKFDGTSWSNVKIEDDSTKWVNAIAFEDGGISFSEGTMYVGAETGEFCITEGTNWQIFNLADAWNPNNSVTDIKIDATKKKWIATSDEGLYFYDGTQIPAYNTENSAIPSNNIYTIDVSNNNDSSHVWMSNNGLTVYTEANLTDIKLNTAGQSMKLNNYPNPFSQSTTISYTIPNNIGETHVSLSIFNLIGQKISQLVDKDQSPGTYQCTFHAANLKSGIYFYQIKVGKLLQKKKMIVTDN
jgi:ligand-binding sensor domain-containing protein